ncbi:histidine kinase [Paenibacillus sp. MMS20-IR301]|uniref:cache domain-containing sensor histidine kinase n=1 Tax=Paenibacillus sp. MMS20-IR301 TaxID=2895946 RepID=UPI0028E52D02|nr:histidine kinase [Paenibacillus sp. MMS20-IR301]WNS40780.1 histidine kinase [Paenibacillus sp. MMS20-IR301]
MRLQQKFLTGYLVASVIPFLIVSAIIYNQAATGLEESSQEFASIYTSQIETSLNEFMREYDKVTKSVLVDNDVINKLGEDYQNNMNERILQRMTIQRVLMRVAVLKTEINNVMLIGRDDTVYQYSNITSTVNEAKLLSQDWYKQIKNADNAFFVTGLHDRSYYEDSGEGAAVTLGRVLFNSGGAMMGVLLIDMDPYKLLELNHDFVLARDKYGISVIISTATGDIVYHSDGASSRVSWSQILEDNLDYSAETSNKEQIVITGSTELGDLIIKTLIPRKNLLVKIDKIKVVTGTTIVAGWLVMSALSLGLSYRITKPIIALRRSMKQVENGHYVPIESARITNDEIGSLVNSYNRMVGTIRTLIEDVYIAEIKHRKAKFLALQNQINPHMLYNTLESIRMKALIKGDKEVSDMIKILARMFRLALGKEGDQHSIGDELEYTANYLKLQNIRYDNHFNMEIRLSKEMQRCHLIPLVFQPIVENSIIHGFEDYSTPMNIVIEGRWAAEGGIVIRISDDGCGMSRVKQEELQGILEDANSDKFKLDQTKELIGKGLGLKNIAERIKLNYGDPYYLAIVPSDERGTIIELYLPSI